MQKILSKMSVVKLSSIYCCRFSGFANSRNVKIYYVTIVWKMLRPEKPKMSIFQI